MRRLPFVLALLLLAMAPLSRADERPSIVIEAFASRPAQAPPQLQDVSTEDILRAVLASVEVLRVRLAEKVREREDLDKLIAEIRAVVERFGPTPPGPTPPGPQPPGPKPPGPKPPEPPAPLSARAEAIRLLAQQNVPNYAGRPAMAGRLAAELFAVISTRISQAAALNPPPADLRAYTTVDGVRTAYVARFAEVVGTEREQWRAFSTAFGKLVQAEQAAGRLQSPGDFAALFDDAAAGLAAAFAVGQR